MTDLLKDKTKLLEAVKKWYSENKHASSSTTDEDYLGEESVSLNDKLKIAIMMNHINDVQALLDIGAEAQGQEGDSLTPLQIALSYDRHDIAELIAQYLEITKKPKPKA